MRWQKDEVDQWCDQWAAQRRKMLGILDLEPRDRIGKLRSTLGAVREEGEGASQGAVTQSFPEVYVGIPLLVHRAWNLMERDWRQVINAQYVWREIPVKIKADEFGYSVRHYWNYLQYGKAFISGYVTQFSEQGSPVMQTQNSLANAR